MASDFIPTRVSWVQELVVRDAHYAVRTWGSTQGAPLLLLHGVRDTSATFQFLVDAFAEDHFIAAPDWRGHGATRSAGVSGWFHEYLADLDALLDSLGVSEPVALVGHSLGGNIATVFAALRPDRVRCVVSLDAFGIVPVAPAPYVDALVRWLDREIDPPGPPRRPTESIELLAQALQRRNRRLPAHKARFLAKEMSRADPDGVYSSFNGERRTIPAFHSLAEWVECWDRIRCPALWLAASDPLPGSVRADAVLFKAARVAIGDNRIRHVPDTSHNVHHDAAALVAKLIEDFVYGN